MLAIWTCLTNLLFGKELKVNLLQHLLIETILRKRFLENIVGKKGKCGSPAFSLFPPQCFQVFVIKTPSHVGIFFLSYKYFKIQPA